MSDLPTPAQHSGFYENEISISEILYKVWKRRALVFFIPLAFIGVTLAGLLADKLIDKSYVSLYVELNGISLAPNQQGSDTEEDQIISGQVVSIIPRYPNGIVFSPQDLLNPSVVNKLSAETGLPSNDLKKYIEVEFGTPRSNGVLAEYRAALSAQSKASAEELAALNQHYSNKLDIAAKQGLKITVNFVKLSITEEEGIRIATAIPRLWNDVFRTQFVTALPSDVAGLFWTSELYDLRSTIGLQEASIQIEALVTGASTIRNDDRLAGLKTSSGITAADLFVYVTRFRSIYFEPLFLAAFEADTSLTRVYERDIAVEIKTIETEIAELDRRLELLSGSKAGGQPPSADTRQEYGTSALDGNALSQVVILAEQASASKYIQETLESRFEFVEAKAALEARLARMRPADTKGTDINPQFISSATKRYEFIVKSYSDLLATAQTNARETTSSYYSMTTEPATEGLLVTSRDLIALLLSGILGTFVGVFSALIRQPAAR